MWAKIRFAIPSLVVLALAALVVTYYVGSSREGARQTESADLTAEVSNATLPFVEGHIFVGGYLKAVKAEIDQGKIPSPDTLKGAKEQIATSEEAITKAEATFDRVEQTALAKKLPNVDIIRRALTDARSAARKHKADVAGLRALVVMSENDNEVQRVAKKVSEVKNGLSASQSKLDALPPRAAPSPDLQAEVEVHIKAAENIIAEAIKSADSIVNKAGKGDLIPKETEAFRVMAELLRQGAEQLRSRKNSLQRSLDQKLGRTRI